MSSYFYLSHSEDETKQLAKLLASFLQKGDLVILTGDLGSGKTKLIEGILTYFHLEDEISSPTFTIVNEYDSSQGPIFHFDVYRLIDSSEFSEIGGEEYLARGICLIEWGEQILDVLPPDYLQISFSRSYDDPNLDSNSVFYSDTKLDLASDSCLDSDRLLKFTAHGERYETLLSRLPLLKEEENHS